MCSLRRSLFPFVEDCFSVGEAQIKEIESVFIIVGGKKLCMQEVNSSHRGRAPASIVYRSRYDQKSLCGLPGPRL
jgi:hypothetical protein